MKVVTSSQMGEIDRLASAEYGIPSIVLMENAGLQVAEAALELLAPKGNRAVIICGTGNNGGDGLVAARHLSNNGIEVTCYLVGEPEKLKGDALTNYIILERLGLKPITVTTEEDLAAVAYSLFNCHLIIDALYGTGFTGVLTGIPRQVVALINQSSAEVIAIDIPSGLDANTGRSPGIAVIADWTVTMGLPKRGLLEPAALEYIGRLTVADISLPIPLLTSSSLTTNLLTADVVVPFLKKPRALDSHKGDYGHVLVIGGCTRMSGAVVMAAQAAMRTGAGLVTAALPEAAQPLAAVQIPTVMTMALPATKGGNLDLAAIPELLAALADKTVGVLGPGMGIYEAGPELVARLFQQTPVPLVIDADALNMLAGQAEVLNSAAVPLVLTPHPGEMARLTGLSISEVQEQRQEVAGNFAREYGVVLVLKGSRTLIASPDGQVFINPTGNPGMATGGSGDVLSGIIAGLIAQGLDAENAARTGVYVHGLAGDMAARELGEKSMLATDIIAALPQVFKELTD